MSFQSSKFRISTYRSIITSEIPTLTVFLFDFLRSNWEIFNTNVDMRHSNASLLTLSMSSIHRSGSARHQVHMNMENCTLGSLTLESISEAHLTGRDFRNRYYYPFETALTISNSLVYMKSISIKNETEDIIINIYAQSTIFMKLSNFSRSFAKFGILQIHESSVNIASCHFIENSANNCGAILVAVSTLLVEDSYFQNNSAEAGGAICVFRKTSATIVNLSFIGNKVEHSGGALFGELYVMITVMNTVFLSNGATGSKDIGYEGGAVTCKNVCVITCLNCYFSDNYAGIMENTSVPSKNISFGGAMSVSDRSSFYLVNVKFHYNKVSDYGGAIVASNSSSVLGGNATFMHNEAFGGACIYAEYNCSVEVRKSHFHSNSARNFAAVVVVSNSSQLNMSEVVMTSNSAVNSAGCLFLIFASMAEIADCSFEENSVQNYMGEAVQVSNTSVLHVMNSTFRNNSAGPDGGSAIAAEASSSIDTDGSSFSYNRKSCLCVRLGVTARIQNSQIDNTKSEGAGAIFVNNNSTLYMLNITLVDNVVEGLGGALIAQIKSEVEINNCTFSGNKASTKEEQ